MAVQNMNTQPSPSLTAEMQCSPEYWHERLVSCRQRHENATGEANRLFLAKMISSWLAGQGALPERLGLSGEDFTCLLHDYFPLMVDEVKDVNDKVAYDPERLPEREDVLNLMLEYRGNQHESENWIAEIVVAACMGLDHLWQDLGLWSRNELSEMLTVNFPGLAALNQRNMKWKKFLYKQLCERDGTYVCRAPSCDVCADYQKCFGPEE